MVRGQVIGSQVIDFTYNNQNVWTNPFNSTIQFLVPDQVNVVDDSASPYTSSVFTSAQNFASAKADHLGINFEYGMFSFSFDIAQSVDSYQNNQAITGLVTQSMIFFEAAIYPTAQGTSYFNQFINQTLPEQYNADVYADFLAQYGTHFIKGVVVGGQAILDAVISDEYYSTSTEAQLSTNLKALFYDLLGYSNSFGDNYTSFQAESFGQFSVLGGNQAIVAQANPSWFQQWLQSVSSAPAAISYSLAPITDLVTNPTIQANIQLAINTYLLAASEQTEAILDSLVYPLHATYTAPANTAADRSRQPSFQRRETENCNNAGSYATGWDTHDGSYISWPVNCNNLYLVQNTGALFQQLGWCYCSSYPSNLCPPNNFVTGFGNHYAGFEGDYPQPPVLCCSACIQLQAN